MKYGLQLRSLTAGYHRGAPAVFDLNLEIPSGEVRALLGPNGAGKSTTLKAIMGIVPNIEGEVLVGEMGDVVGRRTYEIARLSVAYVPEGRGVLQSLTVEENLVASTRSGEIQVALETAYERFPELQVKRRQKAGLLSGGQQQVLVIARALLMRPQVLLLDEPSLGLAPATRVQIAMVIRRAVEDLDLTVLLVEQDISFAAGLADYAYVLGADGRLQAAAEISNLRGTIHDIYLGPAQDPLMKR